MLKDMQKTSNANLKDDIQKASNANLDATMHSFERVTKATQAIVTEITDYSKPDKAIEVQSEYAKTAYEGYVTHASKLGELYTYLAKEALKPYEGLLRK